MPWDAIATGFVALFGAIGSLIIWAGRQEGRIKLLESRVDAIEKRIATMEIKHETLDSKIVNKLGDLERAVARIEGYMKAKDSN